jgi:hypothetical protein
VSFIIGASVLLLTVIISYETSSIPDELLYEFDYVVIHKLQAIFGITSGRRRRQRIDALSHFLLALADQQVVTAAALLIAGYAHWQDITIYAMNVTGALTLLSSVLYLTVLPIITTRDRETTKESEGNGSVERTSSRLYGLAKHLRFTMLVFTFLGMTYLFVLSEGATWWPVEDESDLFFNCGKRSFHISKESTVTAVIDFFILFGFFNGYVDAGFCLYSKETSFIRWITKRLEDRWKLERPRPVDYTAGRSAAIAISRWNGWQASSLAESFAFYTFQEAFACWQLVPLGFAFVYGTTNVFVSRELKSGLTGEPGEWGFGQIVPVVLLALPVLAAFEARSGKSPHSRSL